MAASVASSPRSLFASAREGDPDSFVALMAPLQAVALRLATAMLADSREAEDAIQDATALAWRRLRQLRDPAAVDAWYRAIVVNQCRKRLRAPWRRLVSLGHGVEVTRPEPLDLDGNANAVRSALLRLRADHRTALVLRYFFDLSVAEIAERVGVPEGTVKSRLNRGAARLRRLVDAEGNR